MAIIAGAPIISAKMLTFTPLLVPGRKAGVPKKELKTDFMNN